jgi:mono/diheme cytochrome c family protein
MKTTNPFLATLPLVLLLSFGCSADAGDTGEPLGSGGSASAAVGGMSAGLAGSTGLAGSSTGLAGSSTGLAGSSTGVAGSPTGVAGAAGVAGTGNSAGAPAQGGSGGGGSVMPTDGKGLYELNCKACHGEQGAGTQLAPETQHPVRDYTTWVTRNGRAMTTFAKPMEKFGTDKLSDAQLNLIWDYLDLPPQPTTGATLFGDYCANCHGADGKGGPTTRPLAGEGKNVLKLVREGHNIGQYAMRHDSMPKFSTTRITDAELNLILAHVNSF